MPDSRCRWRVLRTTVLSSHPSSRLESPRPKVLGRRAAEEKGRCEWRPFNETFCETNPFALETFLGEPGDVHVHGQRRHDVGFGAASGLQALKFV